MKKGTHAKRARQIEPGLPDPADRNGSFGIRVIREISGLSPSRPRGKTFPWRIHVRICQSGVGLCALRVFAVQSGRRSFLAGPGLLSCCPFRTPVSAAVWTGLSPDSPRPRSSAQDPRERAELTARTKGQKDRKSGKMGKKLPGSRSGRAHGLALNGAIRPGAKDGQVSRSHVLLAP